MLDGHGGTYGEPRIFVTNTAAGLGPRQSCDAQDRRTSRSPSPVGYARRRIAAS